MDPLAKFSPQQIKVLGQLEMIRQSLTLAADRVLLAYNTLAVEPQQLTPELVIAQVSAVSYQVEQEIVGALVGWGAELAVNLARAQVQDAMQGGSK